MFHKFVQSSFFIIDRKFHLLEKIIVISKESAIKERAFHPLSKNSKQIIFRLIFSKGLRLLVGFRDSHDCQKEQIFSGLSSTILKL